MSQSDYKPGVYRLNREGDAQFALYEAGAWFPFITEASANLAWEDAAGRLAERYFDAEIPPAQIGEFLHD